MFCSEAQLSLCVSKTVYYSSHHIIEHLTFFSCSPSGKLVQIEYALAAVAAGAPSVGIKGI